MSTIYDQAFAAGLQEDPEARDLAEEYLSRYLAGEWDEAELRWFGQHFHNTFSLLDAYAFGACDLYIRSGKIAQLDIEVGRRPGPDKDTEGNNAKLRRLPRPFSAKFYGGAGDSDGLLEWSGPIEATVVELEDQSSHDRVIDHAWTNYSAPLEVDYTKFTRTLWHLYREAGCARWPYGATAIRLMLWVGAPLITLLPDPRKRASKADA